MALMRDTDVLLPRSQLWALNSQLSLYLVIEQCRCIRLVQGTALSGPMSLLALDCQCLPQRSAQCSCRRQCLQIVASPDALEIYQLCCHQSCH